MYVNVGCVYVLVREYMFMGLCMWSEGEGAGVVLCSVM